MKKALLRGLIIALVLVGIAMLGGVAALDIPVILIVILLVVVLGLVSYIAHNHRGDKE